ncbi:MAG: zinc ABC transporter substrate-binding protein [Gammaproteobacteria bacterium]|nr:zinc ABC transporter substrate-binding protein [Gammaproteobacteria bacterium]
MPFLLSLIFLLLPLQLLADSKLKVVTSIHPIQLIADEIMSGTGNSDLLIQSDQSPHHFQLKPSQLKLATQSDLLIWVSNEFETGLNRLQNILPADTEKLELVHHLPQSHLIEDHHSIDGHIWLSPENVLLIAQSITLKLSILDPENKTLYANNLQNLSNKASRWKTLSQQQLTDSKPRYILDHQFLAYFEQSFGLKNIGSLRNSHDQGSSIKQISRLHQQLKQTPAKCLVVTSLPLSQQAQQIVNKFQLETVAINLLNERNSHQSVMDLLDNIVTKLSNCR